MKRPKEKPPGAPTTDYGRLLLELRNSERFRRRKEGREKEETIKTTAARILLREETQKIIVGDTVEYDPSKERVIIVTSPFGTKPIPTLKRIKAIVRNIMAENNVAPDNRPVIKKLRVRPSYGVKLTKQSHRPVAG